MVKPIRDPASDLVPPSVPAASSRPSPFVVQDLGKAAEKLADRIAPRYHQHQQTAEPEQQNELLRQRCRHGVSILAC